MKARRSKRILTHQPVNDAVLLLRLPAQMKRNLQKQAKRNGMSTLSFIRYRLAGLATDSPYPMKTFFVVAEPYGEYGWWKTRMQAVRFCRKYHHLVTSGRRITDCTITIPDKKKEKKP